MRDHDCEVEFLNSLQEKPPAREHRERIVAALRSESDGLARLAAKVLARWGDRDSVQALRDLLAASDGIERFGWLYRDIAVSALARCIGNEDAPWVLDRYFSTSSARYRSALLPLVLRLPRSVVRDRVMSEFRCRGAEVTWAVIRIIQRVYLESADEILECCAACDDLKVADEARRLMNQLGATPYQRKIRALRLLLPGTVPEHLEREGAKKQATDFDANDIFSVLTHVQMQPGYVLDYVYHFDGLGGYPILYSRKSECMPELSLPPDAVERFPDRITSDGTAAAFFELALLRIMGGQFYLFWHANYNDRRVLCHSTDIDELLGGTSAPRVVPEDVATRARALELEPQMTLSEDWATVRVIVFTKWGGVLAQELRFSLTTPHRLIDSQSTCLVEYNCGVMY